ncbi:hypothetical protein SAMN05443432_11270 [Roseovarius litoreus]|uniref:Uncharacterized protein n=1 Tax=Roseovarius litoreus TaxID=1155722 RepID=A0A1M7KY98_9RHOB|nr:hypothetical protein SAMN05443432_11270 [Roseovarius litoreus]
MTNQDKERKPFEVKLTDDHLLLIRTLLILERGEDMSDQMLRLNIQRAIAHINFVRWKESTCSNSSAS